MPSRIEDGGSAFPLGYQELREVQFGMSLRDWFAGQALVGMCANPGTLPAANPEEADYFAREAYLLADAMLRARDGGEK